MHGIPVLYCLSCGPLLLFYKVSSASLISQSSSFALTAVMGCTGIALFPRSTLDSRATMDTASSPGLEEPPSGQSHNLLKLPINLYILHQCKFNFYFDTHVFRTGIIWDHTNFRFHILFLFISHIM